MEPNIFYVAGDYDSAEDHARLAASLKELDKPTTTPAAIASSTSPPRPKSSSHHHPPRRSQQQKPDNAPRAGSASSSKSPSAAISKAAKDLNAILHKYFARRSGLPHRPLSRQGNRAEPDGHAFRQLDFRADLELQIHRSRADHRQRNRSAPTTAPAITTKAAPCAT